MLMSHRQGAHWIHQLVRWIIWNTLGYGRGAGVERALGDGWDLGVGVGRGVAVGGAVAVAVALGVGVGVPPPVTSRNAALIGPQVWKP
jgi:hypothetical protein